MPMILRFVQRYQPDKRAEFMALEAAFARLEQRRPDLPQGRRSQPWSGKEPANTLIWECRFESLADLEKGLAALTALSGDPEHEALLRQQAPFMTDTWTEILEVIECKMPNR